MGASGKAVSLADEPTALMLEPIEKFINQKIPAEWAADGLFLPELTPSAEERRRYAEERRRRLQARGGPRRGPGGPHRWYGRGR